RGVRHGLDWRSAREPLASLFYQRRHRVEFWQPAVIRQRTLAALAFGYTYTGPPDFGLHAFVDDAQAQPRACLARTACCARRPHRLSAGRGSAAIMPWGSRDDKLWPAAGWRAVCERLRGAGCTLRLRAGNARETARAQALVEGLDGVEVLARMDLTSIARQ